MDKTSAQFLADFFYGATLDSKVDLLNNPDDYRPYTCDDAVRCIIVRKDSDAGPSEIVGALFDTHSRAHCFSSVFCFHGARRAD